MRGWMQCAEPAVSIADCFAAARKLALFRSLFDISGCCAGLPPRPAQGLTPPLHSRKGFHPLAPFRWRDSLGLVQSAVSIADCCAAARKLALFRSFFDFSGCCAGLPPGPAQGLSPPLHPRKGHRPLTRFRWRDSMELTNLPFPLRTAPQLLGNSGFFVPFFCSVLLRPGCRPNLRRGYRRPCTRARGFAP